MNRSKQAAMAINAFVVLLVGLALAFVPLSEAQQVPKVPRIGYVSATGDANNPGFNVEAFRHGLSRGKIFWLRIAMLRPSWRRLSW